jgi:hypothetical protein
MFLKSINDARPQQKLFRTASFNANTYSGRTYDYDRRQTVPFDLFKGADRATLAAIMRSMSSYALRNHGENEDASQIALEYTATLTSDGRIKKIHLMKARSEILSPLENQPSSSLVRLLRVAPRLASGSDIAHASLTVAHLVHLQAMYPMVWIKVRH